MRNNRHQYSRFTRSRANLTHAGTFHIWEHLSHHQVPSLVLLHGIHYGDLDLDPCVSYLATIVKYPFHLPYFHQLLIHNYTQNWKSVKEIQISSNTCLCKSLLHGGLEMHVIAPTSPSRVSPACCVVPFKKIAWECSKFPSFSYPQASPKIKVIIIN